MGPNGEIFVIPKRRLREFISGTVYQGKIHELYHFGAGIIFLILEHPVNKM